MDHSSNMPGGMLSLHFCMSRVGAVSATVASSFVVRSLCAHTAANYSKLADSCRHKIFVSSSDQRTVCTICACMLLSPYSPMVHLVNSSLQVVLVRVYGIQLYFCVFDMIYNLEVLLCGTAHQAWLHHDCHENRWFLCLDRTLMTFSVPLVDKMVLYDQPNSPDWPVRRLFW